MKEILLTQGKIAIVDDEEYFRLSIFKWFAHKQTKAATYYAERNITISPGKRKLLAMHTFIITPPPGYQVDHKDGDGLNNQKSNLRLCFCSQNQANSKMRIDCSSGVKGVHYDHRKRRWIARIQVNKNRINLGTFLNIEEAAEMYEKAARQYFGQFARPERLALADHRIVFNGGIHIG